MAKGGLFGGRCQKRYPFFTSVDLRNFEANFEMGRPDDCWVWRTAKTPSGYGLFFCWSRQVRSNRAAWIFYRSPIPEGLCVCHRCDNRACVNPAHLFLGTSAQNSYDRHAKGRSVQAERVTTAKLTQRQVDEIRARYSVGDLSCRDIAADYGVSDTTVWSVVSGRTWKAA